MNSHGPRAGFTAMLFLVVALGQVGCEQVRDSSEEGGSSGVEGLREDRRAAPDSSFLDVALLLGLMDGDPEYLFGAVSSVTVDSDRRVYVGDRNGGTVRVFDADGGFLRWIARAGGGPGEIAGFPAHLSIGSDGHLYVRDGARVTVFGRRTEDSVPDSVRMLWSAPGGGNLTTSRSGVVEDGRYFYPGGLFVPSGSPRFYYTSFRGGQLDGDTLRIPSHEGLSRLRPALLRLGADALMIPDLARVPFSPVPVWDVTPAGTLLSYDGSSSVLWETDVRGDTLRTIELPEAPSRTVPPRERADSLSAFEERVAGTERMVERMGGRLSDVTGVGDGVVERRIPESLPTVISLSVAQDGSIWIERWPPEGEGESRYYDVLDGNGDLRYVVVLRAPLARDPAPWIGFGSIVGIVRDPETGVEQVARFDLP